MTFNEATFWIGLTVAGTGLYFWVEAKKRRRLLSIVMTIGGALAVVYSVHIHEHPNSALRPPVWIWLLAFTWLAIGYDAYDRHVWSRVAKVDVVEEARKQKVRVQVGNHLRGLYHETACHAINGACNEAGVIVRALQIEPSDKVKRLAANLLIECWKQTHKAIYPVLKAQSCNTDTELKEFVRAWGELFVQYQTLVHYTSDGHVAVGLSPWLRNEYSEWRERDTVFISAIRDAEHMDGCSDLSKRIKETGWGQEFRPARPILTRN